MIRFVKSDFLANYPPIGLRLKTDFIYHNVKNNYGF